MQNEIDQRLDSIAAHIKSAECLNAIHACRPGHPLGRDNPFKWRNANAMVRAQDYFVKVDIDRNALKWLQERADEEFQLVTR